MYVDRFGLYMYKTLIKKWIFNYSDEIEIKLHYGSSKQPLPTHMATNFQNLIWNILLRGIHWKPSYRTVPKQSYCNCKAVLSLIISTIQLNSLFVFFYTERIINKAIILQYWFSDVLSWHSNVMSDKGLIFLMNILPDVYMCHLRKKECTLSFWGDSKMYTSCIIEN